MFPFMIVLLVIAWIGRCVAVLVAGKNAALSTKVRAVEDLEQMRAVDRNRFGARRPMRS